MMKNNKSTTLKKYCLWFVCLIIVSGCANKDKRNQIVGIQKIRIKKLEKQLHSKQQIIEKLKASKWVNTPVRKNKKTAFIPLKQHIKKKQWVDALKVSSRLSKIFPNSRRLAQYRIVIFKRMGLKKQAKRELKKLNRLRAKRRSRRSRI